MSIYADIDPDTLRARLTNAQNAYDALATGAQLVSVRKGDKQLTFTPAELGKLAGYIRELQAALGITPARVRGFYLRGGKGL